MISKVASVGKIVSNIMFAKVLHETSVVTNGCFDLLHRGHVEYLHRASQFGNLLTIVLNSDKSIRSLKGNSRPIVNQDDRAYMLSALPFVDHIVLWDEPRLDKIFELLPIDIYVKGGDYNIDNIDIGEKEVLLRKKCRIEFIKFIDNHSTTDLINKIKMLP